MCGCELEEVYPVVPLAEGHALSIGLTTVGDEAFFGIYADRAAVPDADLLARLPRRVRGRAGGPGRDAMTATAPLEHEREGALLLTGATGFVGMELLARYLERTDRHVYALVRADDEAERRRARSLRSCEPCSAATAARHRRPGHRGPRRHRAARSRARTPNRARRAGRAGRRDRPRRRLGFVLAPARRSRGEINVEGTRRLLEFAELCQRRGGLRRFSYVSTAYVAGTHAGEFRRGRARRRAGLPQRLRALEVRGRAARPRARRPPADPDLPPEHHRRRAVERLDRCPSTSSTRR